MVRIESVVRDREPLLTCVFHAAFGHHSKKKNRRSLAAVNRLLETHIPTLFHAASTLSGSLRSPPSPRGEGGPRQRWIGCSRKRHTCNDRPTYLSYRHCPIRLTSLATFPSRGRLCIGDSDTLVNGALETISLALFHTASPIQPPPLRGTSFHRKEGASTRAPSRGRGCRAQRGGVGFLLGQHSGVLVNCRL